MYFFSDEAHLNTNRSCAASFYSGNRENKLFTMGDHSKANNGNVACGERGEKSLKRVGNNLGAKVKKA